MPEIRIGSLFAGVGGLELGLELATGGRVVWQVECEDWPRRVLARHWPDADRSVTDVRGIVGSHLPAVDLMCGGFPCQDISPAGKGGGIDGEKSGLWSAYASAIRHLRPRYVVVENSHLLPVRGLSRVLGDLAGLGYDAEWARIGACDVGAPHRRWRCFVVAWLADADRRRHVEPEERQLRAGRHAAVGDHSPARDVAHPDMRVRSSQRSGRLQHGQRAALRDDVHGFSADVAGADCVRRQGLVRAGLAEGPALGGGARRPAGPDSVPASGLRRVADGLPGWLGDGPLPRAIAGSDLDADGRAALRALGNAVVPAVAYEVGLWLRRAAQMDTIDTRDEV